MTRQELLQYMNNPNVSKFRDVISILEGSSKFSDPYLAQGGTRGTLLPTGYSAHPYATKQGLWKFRDKSGRTLNSTANGKYAIKWDTWNGIQKALGPLTFSPQDQDLAALYLINQRGALQDVVNGNWQNAFRKLGNEWASFPTAPASYNQFKHNWDKVGQAFKTVGLDPASLGLSGNYTPIQNTKYPATPQNASPAQQVLTQLGGTPVINIPRGQIPMASAGQQHQHRSPFAEYFNPQPEPRQTPHRLTIQTNDGRGIDNFQQYLLKLQQQWAK